MGLLIFFSILFIIVMLHEAGHLIVAKYFGVRVNIFSIGFGWRIFGIKFFKSKMTGRIHISWRWFNFKPSKIWLWTRKEVTEYRIAPFLLGGFCAMDGETKSTGKESDLVSKPYFKKVAIVLAGVTVNFITGLLAIYGVIASKIGLVKGINATKLFVIRLIESIGQSISLLCSGQADIVTASETNTLMANIGWEAYLIFFGAFSIMLGIFNLIPIPALDGFFPIAWIVEKWHKNGQKIMHYIIIVSFILLMILQLIILFFWLR